MATMTIRARFDGSAFLPLEHVALEAGDLVDLDVHPRTEAESDLPLGSPARLLQALRSMPPLDKETADEFERVLAEADAERKAAALREMDKPGIFDDLV